MKRTDPTSLFSRIALTLSVLAVVVAFLVVASPAADTARAAVVRTAAAAPPSSTSTAVPAPTTTSTTAPAPTTTTPPPAPATPPTTAPAPRPVPAAPPAAPAAPAAATVAAVKPAPPAQTVSAADASYGCGPALSYLAANAAPGFQFQCPGYSLGHQAMTCINVSGVCPGIKLIVITVPCRAAYMNEAHNSWVLSGLRQGSIDPYGYCQS